MLCRGWQATRFVCSLLARAARPELHGDAARGGELVSQSSSDVSRGLHHEHAGSGLDAGEPQLGHARSSGSAGRGARPRRSIMRAS